MLFDLAHGFVDFGGVYVRVSEDGQGLACFAVLVVPGEEQRGFGAGHGAEEDDHGEEKLEGNCDPWVNVWSAGRSRW